MARVCFIFLWLAFLFVPTLNLYSYPAAAAAVRSKEFSVFEENGKVGLKDENGHILIPAHYDALGWSDGKLSIVDKVVGYQSQGLWGLIHTSNKVITPAEYDELTPGEGSFLVAQKKSVLSQRPSFGVINTSGKNIIPFQYDGLRLSNMRAIVMSRSTMRYRFGLIDLSNKVLIPLEYQQIRSLGSLRYAVENFDHKTAIFSDEGDQVTAFTIDSISAFKKDYAIIYQNERQGIVDRNGQVVIKPIYGGIQLKDDGTIEARETDSWFFLDGDNNLHFRLETDGVKPLSANHYAVISGGKIRLTNNEFKPLHEAYLSSLSDFRDGRALYRTSSGTGVINTEGKVLIPAGYQKIIMDRSAFLVCHDIGHKNRWTILDAKGNTITEKHYQYIGPYNGAFHPVRNRDFWGAVDASGKEIITCVHDSLVYQKGNHLVVKFKGEYGIINLNENWIVTPQNNPLQLLSDELYFEFDGRITFLKSISGDIIYFSDNPLAYHGGYIREQLPSGAHWLINTSGIIIDRSNQPERTDRVFAESEGLRAIYKDGKYGFIDEEGRLRIANRYEDVKPFSDGLAAVRIRNRWGFIDRQEKLAVQPVYDRVENFERGYAIVTQENLSGIVDATGRIVLPLRYDEVVLTGQNRFRLRQGASFGLADGRGTIIIHPKYDQLTDTGNGYVIVRRGDKFGVVTLRGVSTIPMIYDGLTFDPHHNLYMAVKKSPWKKISGPPEKLAVDN